MHMFVEKERLSIIKHDKIYKLGSWTNFVRNAAFLYTPTDEDHRLVDTLFNSLFTYLHNVFTYL